MITSDILTLLIICAVAIVLGMLLGNFAVVFFNRMPGKWLVDYDEEPDEELLHPTHQRLKSTPWKYVLSGFYMICGIYMGVRDPYYAFPAVIALWLVVEMAIADVKYMIVPDQLIMMLFVSAIGFIPYHSIYSSAQSLAQNLMSEDYVPDYAASSFFENLITKTGIPEAVADCVLGALLGFGLLMLMALFSRIIYKEPGIGGADVKLFTALGLITGFYGIIFIFIVTTFISAAHLILLMIIRRVKLTDHRPMVPYIAIAFLLYILFFHRTVSGIMWLINI